MILSLEAPITDPHSMEILALAVPFVTLAACCWIVTVARVWFRVVALVLGMSLSSYFGYSFGRALEKSLFISNYVSWFTKYASYLHQLADTHDCDTLTRVVTRFDMRFGPQPNNAHNLEDATLEVLEAGPYHKDVK